ncbi:unnamed protein product, partial [Polarella glacialis]
DPFPEEATIKRYYPQAYHGTDKLGRPIYIERPGYIDMPRLLQSVSDKRILEYVYAQTEQQIRRRLPACSLALGQVVDKSLNIMDLDGLSFRVVTHTTARKVVKDVVSMLQNHYPECSGRMIIINAPKVFSIAWSFIKPMLDDRTVAKISIFGADQRETWVNALLELVDADQLPALFGGRCLCDGHDQVSCMRSTKGPWADPAVMAMVEESGFANVLTPGGAKLLHERRQAAAEAAEEAEAAEAASEAQVTAEEGAITPRGGKAPPVSEDLDEDEGR